MRTITQLELQITSKSVHIIDYWWWCVDEIVGVGANAMVWRWQSYQDELTTRLSYREQLMSIITVITLDSSSYLFSLS